MTLCHDGLVFEDEWAKAQPVVLDLLYQRPVSPAVWQDLFQLVYKINSWITGGREEMKDTLSNIIDDYVLDAGEKIKNNEAYNLLKVYSEEWIRYYKQTDILSLPFRFESIESIMLEKWYKCIFSELRPLLLNEALKLIEEERNGNMIDSKAVTAIRDSFVVLSQNPEEPLLEYMQFFENEFIEQTVLYYKNRASQYIVENGVLNYMIYADEKLEEEQKRAAKYLEMKSPRSPRHMQQCVVVLVETFEDQILAECPKLIADRDVEKLQRLYRLIRRTTNGIDTVLTLIDEHIKTEGLNDMKNNVSIISTDPEKYVQLLLSMYEKFTLLIREGFLDDARLLTARDKAFRSVVNDNSIFKLELSNKKGRPVLVESKCAELLANYCDLLLRKTQLSKKLTPEEIDSKLDHVLLVLKYVESKDVFMRFHRAHLSRRLILEMSADQEKEEIMVAKLRECGMPSDSISKLSRMLQDIEVNRDLNSCFKQSLTGTNNNKLVSDSINLKVLNGGAWGRGGSEKVKFSLPRELEDFVPEMEAFYKRQHNGRKLCWMHHWSSGTMTFGTAAGGKFDIDVTTFQMAVLYCFNDRAYEKMSLETLRLATELPDAELNRTLMSLVAYPKMKSQILLCDISSPTISPKDFTDSTKFYINHNFHILKNGKPQLRGKVNLIGRLQLSLEANTEKEHESIVALRELRVQEAIVKVMKMRKVITLAQLTMELVEILKPLFLPNRKLIKEQLDWLINNRYIERRKDDINTFVYLS